MDVAINGTPKRRTVRRDAAEQRNESENMSMAIEKKPEQVTISGDDARAAIIDGVQRKLGCRIDEKTMNVSGVEGEADTLSITVDVLGARSGRKSSGGKPGRKPKSTSGNSATGTTGGTTGTPSAAS